MNEQIIRELYENLPAESRGKEADNPDKYHTFYNSDVFKNNPSWPIIALCEDLENGSLTWHIGCDDYPTDLWTNPDFRNVIEYKVSIMRQRPLRFIEIHTRSRAYYFLST